MLRKCIVTILLTVSIFVPFNYAAYSDTASDHIREIMHGIHKAAVLTIYMQSILPQTGAYKQDSKKSDIQRWDSPTLKTLMSHINKRLLQRITARTPYVMDDGHESIMALGVLQISPASLFLPVKSRRDPKALVVNSSAIESLESKLQVDAIVLEVLDAPRRIDGHYVYNALEGFGRVPSHVSTQGVFFVCTKDGLTAFRDPLTVDHPLTQIGGRQFLLEDWEEAENLMIEDFLDDWTRYTPDKKN